VNTVSDREVDETYERGLAALVARSRASAATAPAAGRRRIPALVAIIAVGIPLAALAIGAFVVVTDHARRAAPPIAPSTAVSENAIGHNVRITDSHGLVADVIVEKVHYETRGAGALPPMNGVYAVADVLISTPSAIRGAVSEPEFAATFTALSNLKAQLQTASENHDVARVTALESLIGKDLDQLTLLAQQLLPITFTFHTSDDRSYPAFTGNAFLSGFDPLLVSPDGIPAGITYSNVVFDVPARGGMIRMTDPFSKVVGQWMVPSTSSGATVSNVTIGQTIHLRDGRGLVADVTVGNVRYTRTGIDGAAPLHGLYAAVDVGVSSSAAIGSTWSLQEGHALTAIQGILTIQLAQLRTAMAAKDVARTAELQVLIAQDQQEAARLAQQVLPLAFTYEMPNGSSQPMFSGNALTSGLVSASLGLAASLSEGETSVRLVFDVPSKGGALEMTDAFSNVVERWLPPPG
jgi:hypothetical protein